MNELFAAIPLPVLIILGLIIAFSLILIVYSYFKNRTLEQVREDVYQLFLRAEHKFRESSAGKQKMKWVIQQARKLLPSWMQALISEEALAKIIQIWFDQIKDLLDDGKVNNSQGGE